MSEEFVTDPSVTQKKQNNPVCLDKRTGLLLSTDCFGKHWLHNDLVLNLNGSYVLHSLQMTHGNTDFTLIFFSSFGTHLLKNIGRICLL